MIINNINNTLKTNNYQKVSVSDSFSTGKYDPPRVCGFCQEYIDQFEASIGLQVEGDQTSYQLCNACKDQGVTVEAASAAVSTISAVLKKVSKFS